MAVSEGVDAYSTTASSNTPSGTDAVGPDLDNHLRDIKKNIRFVAEASQSPAASAPTGFRGRQHLDTSATASSRLVLRVHDGTAYRDFLEVDSSAGQVTPYVGGSPMGTFGKSWAGLDGTGSARTSLGFGDSQAFVVNGDINAALQTGTQTITVPARAMTPETSNGAESETVALGSVDLTVLAYDASTDEAAQFVVEMPAAWDLSGIKYKVHSTSEATDTDGFTWSLQLVAVQDGDDLDSESFGTAVTVDDAAQGVANDLLTSPLSGNVVPGGTPANGNLLVGRLFRDVSDANDTMAEDARLISLTLYFTADRHNDD